MRPDEVEALRVQYTDKYVSADSRQPELARFAGMVGQVKTVNMAGQALVRFVGADEGWHNIALDRLTVVEKPAEPVTKCAAAAAKKAVAQKPPQA
jgi:hypothetical protein